MRRKLALLVAIAVACGLVVTQLAPGAAPEAMEQLAGQIAQYRAVPKFKAPGPAFDARAATKGKTLFVIPANSAVPFVTQISDGMARIAKQVGLRYVVWQNQGTPAEWVKGMDSAISQKASAIGLLAGNDPAALQPQIRAAKAKGIGTTAIHLYDVGQKGKAPNVTTMDIHYEQAGRLLADYALWKTRAKVNALVITINEVKSTVPMVAGIKGEFKKYCPGCKLSFTNVSIPDLATKVQPQVQAAITADKSINYVIALYDSAQAPFAAAAIRAAGAVGRVKIVTFNGTPAILKMVAQGDIVEMDVGENLDWISYAAMDQEMRLIAGMKPVKDEGVPLRVFDKTNIKQAGTPPEISTGYGKSYVSGYEKLWKLK